MINIRVLEITFTGLISEYVKCPVIRANQVENAPPYDYIAYTIINPLVHNKGHYGVYSDVKAKQVKQTWSFTCFSNEQENSQQLAINLHAYLDIIGHLELKENGLIIQSLTNITSRDTILTVGYEYRNGFDATLTLSQIITEDEELEISRETINKIIFKK